MPNPFSWDYLTHRPGEDEIFGPFSTVYLVVFLLGFFVAVFLYNEGGRYLTDDPVRRHYLRKYAGFLLIPLVLGLFFFGIRVLQIDPFSFGSRIWLYWSLLGLLGVLGYAAWDIRKNYQRDLAARDRRRERGRYINRPRTARASRGERP